MDDPTHANESQFWDLVADWLLEPFGLPAGPLSMPEIKARPRDDKDGLDHS